MRRFITTEKKRATLNKLWKKYDRAVDKWLSDAFKRSQDFYGIPDLRAQIEDFVYDNGGTLE